MKWDRHQQDQRGSLKGTRKRRNYKVVSGGHGGGNMMINNYCGGEDYLIALKESCAIKQFINNLENDKGYSQETLDLYHNYLLKLFDYFIKKASRERKKPLWSNLDNQVLKSFKAHLCRKGDTQEIIASKLSVITLFFNYLSSSIGQSRYVGINNQVKV